MNIDSTTRNRLIEQYGDVSLGKVLAAKVAKARQKKKLTAEERLQKKLARRKKVDAAKDNLAIIGSEAGERIGAAVGLGAAAAGGFIRGLVGKLPRRIEKQVAGEPTESAV